MLKMKLILCYRLKTVYTLTIIFGLSYLTGYLFYRNSVIKTENIRLYVELDQCKTDFAHDVQVKDTEIKLAAESHTIHWEEFSASLSKRPDRRKVHFKPINPDKSMCESCDLYVTDSDPSGVVYECVTLKVRPDTPICLHPRDQDPDVSGWIRDMGVSEADSVRNFQRWLERDDNLGFIDVGCYIGVYTLAAAVMDRDVVAVDPDVENLNLLHSSLRRGQLDSQVTTLHNGVSNVRGKAEVIRYVHRRRATELKQLDLSAANGSKHASNQTVRTILLNDLMPFCPFRRALFRIDLNGLEHRAFAYADVLFNQVYFPAVLMEWERMKAFYWLPLTDDDRLMVESMIRFLLELDYTPVDWDKHVLHVQMWDTWPSQMLWVHKTFKF